MKSPDQAAEFINYLTEQLKVLMLCSTGSDRPRSEQLIIKVNQILLDNEGYEDYFVFPDSETGKVGLYRYSTLPEQTKKLIEEAQW